MKAGIDAYSKAQFAVAQLKQAVYQLLEVAGEQGLTNATIGKSLGIYAGHIRHEGHISRTILSLMESEKVVEQMSDKKWRLSSYNIAEPE